jgi:signal transduction histidine kinase
MLANAALRRWSAPGFSCMVAGSTFTRLGLFVRATRAVFGGISMSISLHPDRQAAASGEGQSQQPIRCPNFVQAAISRLKIASRLRIAFGIVLLLTALMGGLALHTMLIMSELTSDLHSHPFAVTNALLELRAGVQAERAGMVILVFSEKPSEVERSVAEITAADIQIAHNFDVVRAQYLGDSEDVRQLAQSLDLWKAGRDERIAMARAGRFVEAAASALDNGQPRFNEVSVDVDRIYSFSTRKAAELRRDVDHERQAAVWRILGALVGILVLGAVMARLITNSIVDPLGQLRQNMARLSAGDLSIDISHGLGDDEVSEMARAVEVFQDTAVRLDRQRWIKDGIAQLSLALQRADSLAAFGQISLDILAPLVDATWAVFHGRRRDDELRDLVAWGAPVELPCDTLAVTVASHGTELGTIEMMSEKAFSEAGRLLLSEAQPVLALNLEILDRNLRTQELLSQTQMQAKELKASQAEMERFSEVLAHHIQEPVRLQHSYAQLLLRKFPADIPDDARVALGFITDGATRLRSLIRDVQLYLGLKELPPASEPCDAEAAFDAARHQLSERLAECGAVIEKADLPPMWIAKARLTDVFRLLLDNAIQYRRRDRGLRITVTAERQGDKVVVRIGDNGIGIPPEYRERVFRVFERLHSNREAAGTGIGLALTRKIVELADGSAWIDSGEDGGTCVCLALPATQDA